MSWQNSNKSQLFQGKNALGIDYGTKVTGLATYCPGKDPYPLRFGAIEVKSQDQLIQSIVDVVEQELIDFIVIGLPLHLDGNESAMTQKVREFAQNLGLCLPAHFPVHFQDETLSSYEAQDRLKQTPHYNPKKITKAEIDTLAAVIILEDFFRD